MSAPARLLGLRVQGFKSFAERTLVEFGPGISAVVGPNGSGKSNLADALRWALGEQGRSLRIRRSEDVIWAGSERRSAQGMADVTIVLDNGDALLPVEYSVVELGRRLYRSGENDYLLNRQRVRLRDLVDLLDSANLAENAFLFIGQGMVDQALALRPEERRPLFEEVAGVRRHERRRRKAEEQLGEAEGNLARVEDILAELRPQARRLGQLAEQQATRLTAGEELAAALIVAAHARWHEAATQAAAAERGRDALRAESGLALAALEQAESEVAEVAASMAARAELEGERRSAYEAVRTERTALGLREARAIGELEAAGRDRARITRERAAGEADLEAHRRGLAQPVPEPDLALEAALADADRALAEGLAELGELRAASRARGDELAALRRAEAARTAEAEAARRRLADLERRAADEATRADAAAVRAAELESAIEAARATLASGHGRGVDGCAHARGGPAGGRRGRRRAARRVGPGGEGRQRAGGRDRPAGVDRAAPGGRGGPRDREGGPEGGREAGGRGAGRRPRPAARGRGGPRRARACLCRRAGRGGRPRCGARPARRPRADRCGRPRTRWRDAGGASPARGRARRDRRWPAPGRRPARRRGRGSRAARPGGVGARPRGGATGPGGAAAGLAGRDPRRGRGARSVLDPDRSRRVAARGEGRGRSPGSRGRGARTRGRRGRPRAGDLPRPGSPGPRRRSSGLVRRSSRRPRHGAGPRRRSAAPAGRSRRPPARRPGCDRRPIASGPSWIARVAGSRRCRRRTTRRRTDPRTAGPQRAPRHPGHRPSPRPSGPGRPGWPSSARGAIASRARRAPTTGSVATPRPDAPARRRRPRSPSGASPPPTRTSRRSTSASRSRPPTGRPSPPRSPRSRGERGSRARGDRGPARR